MAEEKRMRLWSRATDDTDTFPAVRDDDVEPEVEPDDVTEPDDGYDADASDGQDTSDEADADEADEAVAADSSDAESDPAAATPPHLETGSPEWLSAKWSAVLVRLRRASSRLWPVLEPRPVGVGPP